MCLNLVKFKCADSVIIQDCDKVSYPNALREHRPPIDMGCILSNNRRHRIIPSQFAKPKSSCGGLSTGDHIAKNCYHSGAVCLRMQSENLHLQFKQWSDLLAIHAEFARDFISLWIPNEQNFEMNRGPTGTTGFRRKHCSKLSACSSKYHRLTMRKAGRSCDAERSNSASDESHAVLCDGEAKTHEATSNETARLSWH